jgi:tetratricopeptide (TPR) repeat protein
LNPNFAFPYNNRGLVYYNKKDYNKAISDFTEAIRINPSYFFAYYDRGLSYDHIREYDKAISDYTEAIRLKEDADAYCARGWAFYEQREYTKAINDYNEAIRLNPNFALAYTDRGTAYQKLGKLDKAKADFAKAAQLQ